MVIDTAGVNVDNMLEKLGIIKTLLILQTKSLKCYKPWHFYAYQSSQLSTCGNQLVDKPGYWGKNAHYLQSKILD